MKRTQERGRVAVYGLSIFTVRCSRILSRFLKNKKPSRTYIVPHHHEVEWDTLKWTPSGNTKQFCKLKWIWQSQSHLHVYTCTNARLQVENKGRTHPFVVVFDFRGQANLHDERGVLFTVLCQDQISIFTSQVLRGSHEEHVSSPRCLPLLLSRLYRKISTYAIDNALVYKNDKTLAMLVLNRAPPWPSSWCVWAAAGRHGDLAEPELQMNTSSGSVDGTGAISWAPCEWGRRAASAPAPGWSAVKDTQRTSSSHKSSTFQLFWA